MEQHHAIVGSPAESLGAGTIIDSRYRLASAVVRHTTDAIYTALDERSRQRVRVRITPQEPDPAMLPDPDAPASKHAGPSPGLPTVIAAGRIGHWHYVVTEWFDGEPLVLPQLSDPSSRPSQRAWLARALELLDVIAHARRISGRAHGNLSLSSFWEGRDGRLRIIDASAPDGPLGPEGVPYASPERLRGMPRDDRSDVYQAACVIYALLFGAPPYGSDLVEARSGHLLSRLPDLQAPSEIDPTLFAVLRTALEKQPHHRFASVEAMRAALDLAASESERHNPSAEGATETIIRSPADMLFPTGTIDAPPVRSVRPGADLEADDLDQDERGGGWIVLLAALVVFGLAAASVVWVAALGALALVASQSTSAPDTTQAAHALHTEHPPTALAAEDIADPTAQTHAPALIPVSGTVPVDFQATDWRKPTVRATFPQFLELVRQHPGLVKLTGHTDNIGPAAINYKIGLGRAWAARKILVLAGIEEPKLPIDSKGESAPIADNTTPEGRASNRRVTAEFLPPGSKATGFVPPAEPAR